MAKQKLTSTVVLKAQAKGQNSIVWDTEVSGFGLRMSASGHKGYLAGASVAEIGERFLREHVERKRKPSTAAGDKRPLASDSPKWLRQRSMGELNRNDAERFHGERVETRVALPETLPVGRGAPNEARVN